MREKRFNEGDKVTIGRPPFVYASHYEGGDDGVIMSYGDYLEYYKSYILLVKCKDGVRKMLERELNEFNSELFPIF